MKAQVRMIIASVIVIALALTAVSGITYSWFSDTEQSDITITTGKIDLDATYSDYTVTSYGGTARTINVTSGVGSQTTDLGGTVTVTEASSTAGSSSLAISFKNAAPGDEITFKMAVTLVNTIYVTYKQSIVIDSGAPFTITGFESIEKKGVNIKDIGGDETGINTTSAYMIGTNAENPASVTIKFKEDATVSSYGDKQYTIILAVQAIQMNVEPAEIAATKTIDLDTASADTVLKVQSADNTKAITVTIPSTTTTSDTGVSNVSVTAKAMTASEIESESTFSAQGSALAGVQIEKSTTTLSPGDNAYFIVTMNVGTLSGAQQTALKVYHRTTQLTTSPNGDGEYYAYADGVVTIYAKSFSPFVVIDGCEAAVGSVPYATLSDAIEGATDGQVVSLIKNVTTTETLEITGKSITLDLNDKDLEFTGGNAGDVTYNIVIQKGAGLTVTGTDASMVTFSKTWGFRVFGELTINGDVTFNGAKINDSVVVGTRGEGAKITINGGTFNSHSYGVAVYAYYGDIVINDGQYTGTSSQSKNGWLLNQNDDHHGTITVYGGQFVNYDPANGDNSKTTKGTATTFVAEGYENKYTTYTGVVKIGTTYYDSFSAAIKAAEANDTIQVMTDISVSEAIVISTPGLTMNLNGYTISQAIDFNGYNAETKDYNGLIEVKCNLTINNGTLKAISSSDAQNTAYRVINVNDNTAAITLNLNEVHVVGPENGYGSRGISAYGNTGAVMININGGSVSAHYYSLNDAGGNTNITVNFTGSAVSSGYCAVQSWSSNSVLNFKDCTVIGNNEYSGSTDGFATIVVNEGATDTKVIFDNCTIIASETGEAHQYFLDLRCESTAIMSGCTYVKNEETVTSTQIEEDLPKIYGGESEYFTAWYMDSDEKYLYFPEYEFSDGKLTFDNWFEVELSS